MDLTKEAQISVIIPVYNVRNYLEEALDSVLNQTYRNLEIIIVDDGSTDGSGKICDDYAKKDSRIRVVHQENMGLSAARNTGLDIMHGELVSFLDPDDAFRPNMLFQMLVTMKKYQVDMVCCKFSEHKTTARMTPRVGSGVSIFSFSAEGLYTRKEAFAAQIENRISVVAWDKLYKAELFRNIRFPVGRNFEDIAVILPLIGETDTIYVLNECLVMHRKRPGSITMTLTTRSIYEQMRSRKDYIGYVRNHLSKDFSEQQLNVEIQNWYKCLLGYYLTLIGSGIRKQSLIIRYLKREIRWCRDRLDHQNFDFKLRMKEFLCYHIHLKIVGVLYNVYKEIKGIYVRFKNVLHIVISKDH